MPKPVIPPGHVLIRLDDLARLAVAAGAHGKVRQPEPPGPDPAGSWEGLAAAVALATARLGGTAVSPGDLAPEVPESAILAALLALVTASLKAFLPDHGERLLRDLGLAVARESTRLGPGLARHNTDEEILT